MGEAAKAKATILVVDDDQSILAVLGDLLQREGYHVLRANHSDEALDISAGFIGDIDLLVTDVKMDPSMTGYQLAQCLRLMRVEIKVLYISGFVEDEMVRWEVENSVAGFLPKPFQTKSLIDKVRDMLSRNPV
jgi:DNA-binding NtrC family response regulator